ncbi:MAG: molybdate ABC transporter permease subunit [Actinophytocola sp.]|nr:molybdate ABC transporter permease subunit [Actinophytocola sp.]
MLLAFLLLPLLSVFVSMGPAKLIAKLRTESAYQALVLSMQTTLIAVAVIVLFGTPLALWLAQSSFPGKRVVEVAVQMPIVAPPAVAGVGLFLVFGEGGLLGGALSIAGVTVSFTTAAVVMAQTLIAGPFYVVTARQAFDSVGAELLAVSRTLGVRPWATFWRIMVPLAAPGMLTGVALSAARALGEFGATIVFAGNLPGSTQTMPLAIFTAMQSDFEVAVAMSALLVSAAFVMLLAVSLINRRWQRVTSGRI